VRRAALAIALLLAVASASAAAEAVTDGGFEAGTSDNPHWAAASTAFGTPICSPSACRDDTGEAAPHTGSNWVVFGSTYEAPEQASVSQVVSLPMGSAVLSFWAWIGARSGNQTDAMRVRVDGQNLWELREDAAGYGSYREVVLGIHGFADGSSHTLTFEYTALADPTPEVPNYTVINLDDVSIDAIAAPTPKQAGVPFCKGKPATIVGTDGDDTMVGTAGDDVLILGDGNDRAKTKGGNDRVCAGAGKDVVAAGGGKDVVLGEGGNDLLKGGGGNDKLIGGGGKDKLIGGGGKDTCKGGPGKDRVRTCEKGKA